MFEFLVAVSEFHSYRDIEEPYKDDLWKSNCELINTFERFLVMTTKAHLGPWKHLRLKGVHCFGKNVLHRCLRGFCIRLWTRKLVIRFMIFHDLKKQPSRSILRKRCPEKMQQIFRRTIKLLCIFLEYLFIRIPLESSFWIKKTFNLPWHCSNKICLNIKYRRLIICHNLLI